MIPKKKARELYDKLDNYTSYNDWDKYQALEDGEDNTKQCALIAVDEILNEYIEDYKYLNPKDEYAYDYVKSYIESLTEFWKEVKQEIEKL